MLNIIVAIDKNYGIGIDNGLLAYIKEDLRHFKNCTLGKTVAMGYNTYLSLPTKPLVNRRNIVLTTKNIKLKDVEVVNSVQKILEIAKSDEIFIIGGASLYQQFLPYADKLYITHIFERFNADTYFPDFNKDKEWKLMSLKGNEENIFHPYPHIFAIYERRKENNHESNS